VSSFLEIQDDAYFWLGTSDRNQAFPRTQIKRLVNQAQDALHEDCLRSFPDALVVPRTLTADGTDATAYVFGSQSPAILNVALIAEVRLADAEGRVLTEVPFAERHRRGGATYSLVGFESPTLYLGPSVTSGGPVYVAYVPAPAEMSDDGDAPDWMPPRFHDVLSLMAARLASGSGNEQQFSPELRDRLDDRVAQLRFAFGQRSLSPRLARVS
jgi:hypothetical protein